VAIGAFQFGDYKLDCDRFELWRAGRALKLEKMPMDLLILLASRKGDLVTREEIAARLWGGEVFVDTEHGINTAIRKIRYILRDDSDQPRFVQTVMGKGYRFVAPIEDVLPSSSGNGYKLAVEETNGTRRAQTPVTPAPASTAFEPATAEIADPPVTDPAQDAGRPSFTARRRLWPAAAAVSALLVILVALAAFAVRSLKGRASKSQIHSLAVLPLDNLSGDPGQDYFADGMTDELTTMLAKDSTLRIVSRTSVMQYKGVHRPLREIARELGVDGVVEGSVERSGDKAHMTLQLIQAPSDTHVWAESYDRAADDLVSLPDEAAMAIAKRTDSSVLQRTAKRYVNPEAHDDYLHGRYLWFWGSNEEAGKYFRKAVELQPDYALAWTGVSDYYALGMVDGTMDPRLARTPFEAAAQKAVNLDDTLPQAHLTLCAAMFFGEWDLVRADRECVRATDLDPRFGEAYHLRAKLLTALNRPEEAIAAQKKAMELDPFSRPWALAYIYWKNRQYDAALVEDRQRLESKPHDPTSLYILAGIYRCKGMTTQAVKAWEDALIAGGHQADAAGLRRAFARGGYRAVLLWNLENLKKQATKHYVSPVNIALQYAQLGRREETLSLLEEGYRQHSPLLLSIQTDPAYDFLHSDVRYRSIIHRAGLPPAY
jgi:TolB-like protein/DNA-binding winged helix-turn-helix (wHTH) protein/Tfp pilus assembly protein PilF